MSTLEIGGSDYDDLTLPSSMEGDNDNVSFKKPSDKDKFLKLALVPIFNPIPQPVMEKIRAVTERPSKKTRFQLATSELEHELEYRVKSIIPCARLEFKPTTAEAPDVSIYEGNKVVSNDRKDPCNIPNRRVGCMNFIHQDRPKDGVESKKYISVMFFHFENENEYEQIKQAVVDFFKEMDTGTNVQNSYNNSVPNDIPINPLQKRQRIQGGKHRKKTQKKKKGKSRVTRKHRSKSKRHARK